MKAVDRHLTFTSMPPQITKGDWIVGPGGPMRVRSVTGHVLIAWRAQSRTMRALFRVWMFFDHSIWRLRRWLMS
jgi:hypothetical protein